MTVQGVALFDFIGGITIAFIAVVALLVSSKPQKRNK
jgi:hypothetical protein